MAVTLRQLQVFTTVARERTLTAAAASLFLTKPAVSVALSELEKQCDRTLFDRHRNRLYLNDQGRRLLPMADELLARSDAIDQLFDNEALGGQLHVGASYTIGHQLLPALLSDFRIDTGHRDQRVNIANSAAICRALELFELDIGLIEGRVVDECFDVVPWCQDHMLIVCSPEHPLARRDNIEITDLVGYDWLLREPGSGTREQFMRFIAPRLPQWQLGMEINSAEAIINAAAVGLGLTCVSTLEARHALYDGRLIRVALDLDMTREFSLVLHRDKYRSPLIKRFTEFCLARSDTMTL
ncbi:MULTISPECIES: LysR family transcriptional regulator [Kushneria]|uniref:LysR family transcriptional regulator n=2 Tax=Kushneria TaxID=504090 RepID=A0A240UQ69_9GAMM|nr:MULTISPECIES: LysR family transcriptional regulator [Kushneria]ARS52514.1 LysR family transcriptional regulator [Kushneria konosiri]ART63169.1 LysR family transcriptional regulator [Kushneria marisflavi]RKD84190.1 DNA-binding transcriptional LysR family regulator [Kushneria marisflavi]